MDDRGWNSIFSSHRAGRDGLLWVGRWQPLCRFSGREAAVDLSRRGNSECFPHYCWIGSHPSVTIVSTERSAAFWLRPAIPTLVIHQPREIAICQGSFCYQSPRSVEIAFLHFLEGCGDEFKPGTSATYSWSSVLLLFCAFLHQNENRMIRVSKLHSVDAMCPTRSLPSFPKCFREGLSLSSGWMKEDASASKYETA